MLEHRDQYGRRVYIYRPGKWNPDKSNFNEVFCVGYALSELVALETKTQIAGVTTIADAKDFGFHQLRSFTLDNARSAASFVQDSCRCQRFWIQATIALMVFGVVPVWCRIVSFMVSRHSCHQCCQIV